MLKILILVAVVAAAFWYNGVGASFVHSATTVVAVLIGWHWIQQELEFSPFWFRLRPTVDLLLETGLADEHDLARLRGESGNPHPPGHSVLRDGIGFTLLRVGLISGTQTLVYWNDHKTFSTEIETFEPIDELARSTTGTFAQLGFQTHSPTLFVKQVRQGIQIGVIQANSHQKRVVAVVPWGVFGIRQFQGGAMKSAKLQTLLTNMGWTREQRDPEISGPYRLSHKYATLTWHYI